MLIDEIPPDDATYTIQAERISVGIELPPSEKFMRTSLDDYKSRKIRIYRNGDPFDHGKKLIVSPRLYRNYEQVILLNIFKILCITYI
jgi:hypothetical protein